MNTKDTTEEKSVAVEGKVKKGVQTRNEISCTLQRAIEDIANFQDRSAYMVRKIRYGSIVDYVFGIEPTPNKSVTSRTFLVPQEVYIAIGSPRESISVPIYLILEKAGYKPIKQ